MNQFNQMKHLMEAQFALDYNCSMDDFKNCETLVTDFKKQEGMRQYENEDSILSILSYNEKLVITAKEPIQSWCKEILAHRMSAVWGFDIDNLVFINDKLREYGYQIEKARTYFIPKYIDTEDRNDVIHLTSEDIKNMEEDDRIDEAFLFADYIEDVMGTAIKDEQENLCAVAGATNNGRYLWEIGVNSFVEGKGYASTVVRQLIKLVTEQNKVPFYNTAMSHMASMNVALKAGMVPAFCELRTRKINL